MALVKAVFLDRDGTLNVEKNYLHRIEDWEWLPKVFEGLSLIQQAGYKLIVVTNQAGIARGYYTQEAVQTLHAWVSQQLVQRGLTIDGYYICPHHPKFSPLCSCRKPRPGMLLQAAQDHGISLQHSWMIGDKASDIQAGINAGCHPLLVLTGYGTQERAYISPKIPTASNLYEAATIILRHSTAHRL